MVTEKPGEGTNTISSSITYALSANMEDLTLTGTALINATGNSLANVITANNAANQLASDTVQLENAAFSALTATGTLSASQFKVGAQAGDANDFIIYNKLTGALLYDADGRGQAAAVQIATVSAGLSMTHDQC